MKQLFFFTSRPFIANRRSSLFGLLCGTMLAGLLLAFGPASEASAQTEPEPPAPYVPMYQDQGSAPGLQIYTDEQGNRVMRTNPEPRDYQDPQNNLFYISPEIYPQHWPGVHPGPYPHPRPGPFPRQGDNFLPGGNLGPLHPEAEPNL